jgi:2-amino-4-hydroxy-6-hydroxymethyldihydropteridine diphosphokinase
VTLVYIGLGANLGNAAAEVVSAFDELDRMPHSRVLRRSSLYRSAPIGHADQPDFINAAAQLETGLPAERLLAELRGIEDQHGRTRSFANAPRTLDLDLLLYGRQKIDTAELTLPHPRMHQRAFVLMPLAEIAPDLDVPGRGLIRQLLQDCRSQDVARIA